MKCKYLQRLQNVAHDILTPDLPSPLQVCQAKTCAHASESEAQNSMTEGGRGQGGLFASAITIDKPNQHVVQRNSITVDDHGIVEARFTVLMPARGRKIQGRAATTLLTEVLVSGG